MDKFTKSIWITTNISAAGERGVSLKELNERWCDEKDENEIPRKSFENYRRYLKLKRLQ